MSLKVLLLLVDCLRRDYLSCYGSDAVSTPTLDALAAEGTCFNQAIASATWTPPAVAAIVSGVYAHKLGIYQFDKPFDSQTKTLFHYFREHNYDVGSFVFDEKYLFAQIKAANVLGNFRDFSVPLRWIEAHRDRDFFLYIHYYWVHGPYEPQPSAQAWSEGNRRLRALLRTGEQGVKAAKLRYSRAVEKMSEEWLSQILQTLDQLGIAEETLVVFTADHGESWGERIKDKSSITTNFDMHGRELYDELLRVPLIFRLPGQVPGSQMIAEQVRSVDIAPTILKLVGLRTDGHEDLVRPMDGISLVGLMRGAGTDQTLFAISSATNLDLESTVKIAIRSRDWKLIWSLSDHRQELYDLEADPGEQTNVYGNHSAVEARLESILRAEIDSLPENQRTEEEEQALVRQLKGLGYL